MSTIDKIMKLDTIFSLNDLEKIDSSKNNAKLTIREGILKGYISRIKRNLYAVNDLITNEPYANKFQIATRLSEDAIVSHISAFHYHGIYNQVSYEMYYTTVAKNSPLVFENIEYNPIKPRMHNFQLGVIETKWDKVRVTDIERSLLDSVYDVSKIAGIDEIIEIISVLPNLNEDILLTYLKEYKGKIFFKRLGFLLSSFGNQEFSSNFWNTLQNKATGSTQYLLPKSEFLIGETIKVSKWGLVVPKYIARNQIKGKEQNEF
ncbi:MAG: hypothetical protein LBV67_00950 [Streptococcaceae bacterium]|jgi:predicted transcriptional regulator of viral defense system|nr:hypothetical protein [Streptococcaceae bacterium]